MNSVVYFILNPEARAIKIGYSRRLEKRIINLQTASPYKLDKVASVPGARADELELHSLLDDRRLNGEWFTWDLITHELFERALAGSPIEELIDFATPGKLFTRVNKATGRLAKQIEEALA